MDARPFETVDDQAQHPFGLCIIWIEIDDCIHVFWIRNLPLCAIHHVLPRIVGSNIVSDICTGFLALESVWGLLEEGSFFKKAGSALKLWWRWVDHFADLGGEGCGAEAMVEGSIGRNIVFGEGVEGGGGTIGMRDVGVGEGFELGWHGGEEVEMSEIQWNMHVLIAF